MSEFEEKNEEAFGMIRQNRSCQPCGEKMFLVSKDHYEELKNRVTHAEHSEQEAIRAMHELAFNVRAFKLAYAAVVIMVAVFAYLAGLLM